MTNKNLITGHRGPLFRSQGHVSLNGPSVGHRYILLYISYYSYLGATRAPYRATKTHYRITRAPCRGHETPCKAIRASIGPQESGHKDPLAGFNGPILRHKSHYRVTRHLLILHRPSVRTSNRATKASCRAIRLSFGPLGFVIGTPGSLSG